MRLAKYSQKHKKTDTYKNYSMELKIQMFCGPWSSRHSTHIVKHCQTARVAFIGADWTTTKFLCVEVLNPYYGEDCRIEKYYYYST
jgi:hypothetical protein